MHLGEFIPQTKLIETAIKEISPKEILHIPFARTNFNPNEPERENGRFLKNIDIGNAKYFDANDKTNLDQLTDPLIILSGWAQSSNLLDKITNNPKLLDLVLNASYLIWESSGAKIVWQKARIRDKSTGERIIAKWLNILPNTIIEPHYSAQKRESILKKTKEENKIKFWIWIDSCTAIVLDTNNYPQDHKTIGKWKAYIIK